MKNKDEEKKCARCGVEENGYGIYGELCSSCDNDMRLMCMTQEDL